MFNRKADDEEDEGGNSRKLLKEDDSEPDENEPTPYVGGETLESVQVFHDFPLHDEGSHTITTTTAHHVDTIIAPLPIYTDVPTQSPQDSSHSSRAEEEERINGKL